MSSIRFQVSDIKYQISSIRYQVSYIKYHISSIIYQYQISNIRYQVLVQSNKILLFWNFFVSYSLTHLITTLTSPRGAFAPKKMKYIALLPIGVYSPPQLARIGTFHFFPRLFSFFFWSIKILIYVIWDRFCMIQSAKLWSLFIGVPNNVLLCSLLNCHQFLSN